jgi:high affinity Mn2+ porin
MTERFLIVFSVLLFAVIPLCAANAGENMQEESETLKQRVQQLEERLKEQEIKAAAGEEDHNELSTIVKALKRIAIRFSATGLIQRCVDNDKNVDIPSDKEREDRVDGCISADLQVSKTIGHQGFATVILAGAYGDGIDPRIPSWWGINGNAEGEQRLYLKELWYEHELLDGTLVFTLGKIDLTAYFDSNEVANDETAQFLSPGFVNSAAIEFPDDNGPGFRATFAPLELVDVSVGWGEGDANWNELGHKSFLISEVGFHPTFGEMQGNCRLYGWYRRHHRDEGFISWVDRIRGITHNRNGWGGGLSLDQAIHPYISLFARVGYQDKEVYEFAWVWSVGAEIRGGYWGREHDAIGAAFGMAMVSENYKDFMKFSGEDWQREDESHLELYYRFQLNEHTAISPDFQILWNTQGDNRFNPVTILGIRCTLEF